MLVFLVSCVAQTAKSAKDITVEEAKTLMSEKSDLQILDVRTPGEWSAGVIEGAIKLNIKDNDFRDRLVKLQKDQPTLVYCKKGGRSAKATLIMEELGFKEIYNMLGGYDAYSVGTK